MPPYTANFRNRRKRNLQIWGCGLGVLVGAVFILAGHSGLNILGYGISGDSLMLMIAIPLMKSKNSIEVADDFLTTKKILSRAQVTSNQIESWCTCGLPTEPTFWMRFTDGRIVPIDSGDYLKSAELSEHIREFLGRTKFKRPKQGNCHQREYLEQMYRPFGCAVLTLLSIPIILAIPKLSDNLNLIVMLVVAIVLLIAIGILKNKLHRPAYLFDGTKITQLLNDKSIDYEIAAAQGAEFTYPSYPNGFSGDSAFTMVTLTFPNGDIQISASDVNFWDILVAASEHLKYLPKDQVAAVKEFNDWLSKAQ